MHCNAPTAPPLPERPVTLLDEPARPDLDSHPVGDSPDRTPPRARRKPLEGGVVCLRYELKTPRLQRFYRREYTHLSQLLQSLAHARDYKGVDDTIADPLEAGIATAMSDTRNLLAAATVRIQQQLVQHQLADVPIHYAAPLTVWAPIANPHAREYLETLVDADDTFACVERAWLLGVIDTRARRAEEARLRKAVRSIGLAIRSAYSAMARHLRPPANEDSAITATSSPRAAPSGP